MSTQTAIAAKDITKIYGKGERLRRLQNINWTINKGKAVAIVGKAASGRVP